MADAVTPLFALARNSHTFGSAARSYLDHGGEGRYLPPIVAYFGGAPLPAITPFDIKQMALALLKEQSNATRNRQAMAAGATVRTGACIRSPMVVGMRQRG